MTPAVSLGDTDQLVLASAGANKSLTGAALKASMPVGGMATDALWDVKGDLAVATANNIGVRLGVGTDGQVLTADSAQTTGAKWATPSAGGGGAWTLLSTTTLSSAGTFDVSSISGSYNDLSLVLIGRDTLTGTNVTSGQLRFNNDSSANYHGQRILGAGSSPTGSDDVGSTAFSIRLTAASAPSSSYGVFEAVIYGYASTTWYKALTWRSFASGNTSGASNQSLQIGGGIWANTAAITRVQAIGNFGGTTNLTTGSQLRIYGRL